MRTDREENPVTTKADDQVEIREVTTHEVLHIQRFGDPIVDVREPEEFADGHIPGAVNRSRHRSPKWPSATTSPVSSGRSCCIA